MNKRRFVYASTFAGFLGMTAPPMATAGAVYFDFNQNLNSPNASLFLFGEAGQTATVSNLMGFSQNVVLGGSGFYNLPIPNGYQQTGTGIRSSGFMVQSSQPIGGYFINRAPASTDMTYLLDSTALDRNYVVASQGDGFGEGSQVAIHATADGTNVTFTPRGGAPINVVLNAGETYKYAGGASNLTGSTVSADKNVAVFAGHACAQVPAGTPYCDTLLEQMIPTSKLSKEYMLTASEGASRAANGADLVRVIATQDGTQVSVNGSVVATLGTGDSYEFNLAAGNGAQVSASAPVAIAQYLTGGSGTNTDPAMSMVPGSDTWLDSYRLATPSGDQAFNENYASIVIDTDALGSLMLNGSAVNTAGFGAIGSTGFSRGIVDLPLGLFELTASDPFLVMLGGGSSFDSYLTYGGSTFSPGVSPPPPPPPPNGVPEPTGTLLFGAGLAAWGFTRLRRQNSGS